MKAPSPKNTPPLKKRISYRSGPPTKTVLGSLAFTKKNAEAVLANTYVTADPRFKATALLEAMDLLGITGSSETKAEAIYQIAQMIIVHDEMESAQNESIKNWQFTAQEFSSIRTSSKAARKALDQLNRTNFRTRKYVLEDRDIPRSDTIPLLMHLTEATERLEWLCKYIKLKRTGPLDNRPLYELLLLLQGLWVNFAGRNFNRSQNKGGFIDTAHLICLKLGLNYGLIDVRSTVRRLALELK